MTSRAGQGVKAHAGPRWPEAWGCANLGASEEAALYTYHQKRMIAGYLFISPWVIGFLVFVVGSLLASLFLSFTNWNALSTPQFIGLKNYAKLFFDDPLFWKSVKVTALYSLSIPLNLVFGLLIAVLLNQKIKGLGLFRTIYYLPSVIVGVAVSLLWVWIFNPRFGIFNLFPGAGVRDPGAGLAGGRDLGDPGADHHEPMGRRRADADLPGGAAERAHLLLRGGDRGRRQRLAAVPEDHRADDLAGDPVQPDHGHHPVVPGVHARLRDDRRRSPTTAA